MNKIPDTSSDTAIGNVLIEWYKNVFRPLPWRETTDPYKIWISEIILQQTRVAQGLEYYHRFIEAFPSVRALAEADEDSVMRLWQGLGYYSRARNLMAAARQIMDEHNGVFPNQYAQIVKLKGIGNYTGAAIASFAFSLPYAAVDGNVYRVLARLFDIDLPIDSTIGQRYFAKLAQTLLDPQRPDLFNQATMELGATVCLPKNAQCTVCPLSDKCRARATGRIDALPVKQNKTKVRPRYFHYLHCTYNDQLVLTQRTEKDIWQSLYQFPLVESNRPLELDELISSELFEGMTTGCDFHIGEHIVMPKHQLSHQTIHATVTRLHFTTLPSLDHGQQLVAEAELDRYAIPRLMERYMNEN